MKKTSLLFLILLSFFSCKKEDEDIIEQFNNPLNIIKGGEEIGSYGELIYHDNVIILNQLTKLKINEISQDKISFNYSESFEMIEVNDVLFSNGSNASKDGFARMVTSINKTESLITFNTVQVNVDKVFEKAEIKQSFTPNYDEIENLIEIENRSNRSPNSDPSTQLALESEDGRTELIFKIDFDHNFDSEKDQIKISGFVEYEHLVPPYVDYNYNYFFPQYSYFHINGLTSIKKGFRITYGGKTEEEFISSFFSDFDGTQNSFSKEYRLFSIPFTGASPTNLLIAPKLVIFVKFTLDIEGKLSIEYIKEYDYLYSADWNATNSNGIWQYNFEKHNETPWHFNAQMTGEINLETTPLGLAPIIEFTQFPLSNNVPSYIGFFIHPYSKKLTATANYNTDENCFKFNLVQKNRFKVSLEAEISPIFPNWNVSIDNTIFSTPWTTEQQITEYEKCFGSTSTTEPVFNPNPFNNSTDISINGNLSFIAGDGTPNDATFKLYLGLNNNPSIFQNTTNTNVTYSNLLENSIYYWKVETISHSGNILATSPIWSFTTLNTSSNTIPTISTSSISNITQTNAFGGGNVTFDGGNTVTAKGVCWDTSSNPTLNNNYSNDGNGEGNFTSSIGNLSPNTQYFVRAYATNSEGTAYGNQQSFTTLTSTSNSIPTVSTNTITNITQTSMTCGGNVSTDGGSIVSVKGVCWSTSSNPTINNNHSNDGNGEGNFTSSISSLSPNTQYFVRAYATNSEGTAYGNQRSFSTLNTNGQPNIVFANSEIEDDNNNNNNVIDAGEDIEYDIQIHNAGSAAATNITATISTNDPDINITDNDRDYGTMEQGEYKWNTGDFNFIVDANAPTKTVLFTIDFSSNEGNWSDTFSINIQGESGSNSTPISPTDGCVASPIMQVNTEYIVNLNLATSGFQHFQPIQGQSANGNDVQGFYLSFQVPENWGANHDVKIYDVSSNFDPVFGIKAHCNAGYLGQSNSSGGFNDYVDATGLGGNETSDTNLPGGNNGGTPDSIYHIRIYHFNGSESPNISFKVIVE